MAYRFRQFVVHAKVTVLGLSAGGILLLLLMNRNYKTNFWPGASGEPVATLWLMGATSVLSILVFWIFSKSRRVLAEWAELRREQERAAQTAKEEATKKNLEEQERRIDEKLRRAVGNENSQP